MTNAELIKALRKCGKATADRCWNCNYYDREPWCESALATDAADALEAAEQRIAELLPKEGEWIIDGAYTYNLIELNDKAYEPVYRCSCCNRQTESYLRLDEPKMPEDADFPEYCPHCGARMQTVTNCHTLEEGERKEKKNEKDSDTI